VLLHYGAGPRLQERLAALSDGAVQLTWTPEGDDASLHRELADTDALLHVLEPVTSATMDAAPRLRLIHKLGTGVNTIDLAAARQRGIVVANLPGANAPAVAEHALALMLAVLRRIPRFDADVRAGRGWPLDPLVPESLGELAGRTVGLVGYGAIARRLETILVAIGARVVHHRRDPTAAGWLPLDELLNVADVVSIHVPLTDDTRDLIGADRLASMRPGAVLINTGRGGVVDEAALVVALRGGRLAGAGLDVFADEPLPPGSPLLALPDVVLTPHVAWLTFDTMVRCIELAVANCHRLHRDEPLLNVVG
jgi:phosphoglycerate dehydrogenase-like enzyme